MGQSHCIQAACTPWQAQRLRKAESDTGNTVERRDQLCGVHMLTAQPIEC